jgi:hypothetical protein
MASDAPVPAAPEIDEPAWRSWARGLGIAAAAAVFLALAGAFDTNAISFPARLIYWGILMIAGAVWGRLAAMLMARLRVFEGRVWLSAAVLTVVIATPYLFVVWALSAVMFGNPLRVSIIPGYIGPVFVVSAVMTVISLMAEQRPRETHAKTGEGAAPPRFLERLPLKLKGAELWAVEAEDHYLRVHTDRGSDLILLRLSDAVNELDGVEGAQTHRSWWVAKAAVLGAERGDGRAVFTLKGGIRAPVSRTYARVLRREGWY